MFALTWGKSENFLWPLSLLDVNSELDFLRIDLEVISLLLSRDKAKHGVKLIHVGLYSKTIQMAHTRRLVVTS